jgi:Cu-processing system ATP-binding protein
MPLLEQMGLSKAARRSVGGYSKGMRQRLGFAQALLGKPEILFLDEPTTGLDPKAIREFYRVLHDLRSAGITTVITSHNLAEMQDRVDRLALMRLGQIQAAGTVGSLREKLDLPVHFLVSLKEDGEMRLKQALKTMTDCSFENTGDHATVLCKRSSKLSALKVMTDLADYINDVQINEPSLEDVFFGYVDA